jgi:hypothetical protein
MNMKTLQLDPKTDFGLIFQESKCSNNKKLIKKSDFDPHLAGAISFWTGGTRKTCTGQYSWCFSKALSFNKTFDSQMLASSSSSGACVLATRVRNKNGVFETSFVNEDCNTKSQMVCVAHRGDASIYTRHTRVRI